MNISLILVKINKLTSTVKSKNNKLDTTNLKAIINKGLKGKHLDASQNKILADFFIDIVPELASNAVTNKLITEISSRKEINE